MMAKNYIFHGIRIKLESGIPEIFSIFEKIFDLKTKNIKEHDLRLVFHAKKDSKKMFLPKKATSLHLKRVRNIKGAFDGKKLWLTDRKSVVEVDYKQNLASFKMDKTTLRSTKLFSHTLLPLVLIELLKKHGFYYVHAACADIKGRGIIITGGPGTGKTTACYALVRNKANWISDDAVLIKKQGKAIHAYSFIKEFGIMTGRHSLFPELKRINPDISQKIDISNRIKARFKPKTIPKIMALTDSMAKKSSDIIGRIIKENEFLFLHGKYAGQVLQDLKMLCEQCRFIDLKENSQVLDPKGFKDQIEKILN